ncbi:MAG: hypothetical protein ABI193_09350 [Minicystis sp.]
MNGRRWAMILILGSSTACEKTPEVPTVPTPPPSATAAAVTTATAAVKPSATAAAVTTATGSPGATLCADLGTLVESARKNFPGLRRQDRPVSIDHNPGFEATVVLANTVACRILTSETPYPDVYECDLERATSHAQAKVVLERWASVVATCPVLSTWRATPPNDLGRSWQIETGDDHELMVQLFTAGDDKARPTLVVRRNEI